MFLSELSSTLVNTSMYSQILSCSTIFLVMLFYIFSKLQFVKPTHYSITNIGTLLTGIHSHRLGTWDPYTTQQQEHENQVTRMKSKIPSRLYHSEKTGFTTQM